MTLIFCFAGMIFALFVTAVVIACVIVSDDRKRR